MNYLSKKKTVATLCVVGIYVVLSGCTMNAPRDRGDSLQGKENSTDMDANAIAAKQSQTAMKRMKALIASLEKKAAPKPEDAVAPTYNPLEELKVSLVVENAELQYILKALADQTHMNLLIHPNLIGNSYKVSVDFRDVPAMTVFRELMRIADVSGKIEGNTLIVNPMEERHYQLGFMETAMSNNFSSGGDVLGGSNSGSGGDNKIKGEFSLSGSNMPTSNPYDELEKTLDILVGKPESTDTGNEVSRASSMAEIGSLSRLGSAIRSDMPLYTLNRMTGVLYVRAKPSVMRAIDKIIKNYETILGSQILIDAQIIEINLKDAFRMGVDWSSLRDNMAASLSTGQRTLSSVSTVAGSMGQGTRTFTISTPTIGGNTTPELALHYADKTFAAAVDMMQQYGDVTVLSNPTLRSKHGQPAILSAGTSTAYISNTRVVTNGTGGTAVTSQEVQTDQVFDGLMMGVVPFIDSKGGISLSIHPVQSKVNPDSLALVDAGGTSRVTLPVVELKSMVTQVKVHSGDIVVLGGLIDQNDVRGEAGVPGLGSVPLLGHLFKQSSNSSNLRELVILMRVVRK